ncbi:DUF3107 domain-containing protein [Varibaculum prostatecancerukia]|uniref:DUF3107 domain-containing protein n=1 Tax=Varibaculum prostatecancerukia TaxID=2811781 RepID=UPI001C001721|nr:DUF3107 domain-containing protein [Varibaculum prostatecancerukia]
MNISLGLKGVAKTLDLEVAMEAEQIKATLQAALDKPEELLSLTNKQGQQILINPRVIAYCQISESQPQRVGFGIG